MMRPALLRPAFLSGRKTMLSTDNAADNMHHTAESRHRFAPHPSASVVPGLLPSLPTILTHRSFVVPQTYMSSVRAQIRRTCGLYRPRRLHMHLYRKGLLFQRVAMRDACCSGAIFMQITT